jgi:dUTPase
MLTLEASDGHSLPYVGCVEICVNFPTSLATIPTTALFLVVPTTEYNERVPALLGTNVLNMALVETKDNLSHLETPWQVVLKIMNRHKKVEDAEGSLGDVTTTKAITVPPNGRSLIHGMTRASAAACCRINVMVHESSGSPLPGGLVVSPGVLHLEPGSSKRVSLEVTNYSQKQVTIPAKASICELHHVRLVPPQLQADVNPLSKDQTPVISCSGVVHENKEPKPGLGGTSPREESVEGDSFTKQFHESLCLNLTDKQVGEVEELLTKWQSVFSLHMTWT